MEAKWKSLCTHPTMKEAEQRLSFDSASVFFRGYSLIFFKFMNKITDIVKPVIIPGLSEPPVRTLRATCPENESHIFR